MKSSSRREVHRRSLGNGRRRKSFLKGMQRRLFGEQLESRVLLAGDVLQNTDNPYDTDNNGVFSPADILHVINQLNRDGAPASGEGEGGSTPIYYNDVNGDGFVSPIDALHGINEYSFRAEGEGELVSFRIQAVDVGTNSVINTSNPSGPNFHPVNKGDDYELRVVVDDLRLAGGPDGNPDGVYAAYMDLLYQKLNTVVEIQEIQTLTFGNAPEGGTFTLSFDRDGGGPLAPTTTGNIAYSNPFVLNAEFTIATNIQNALNTTFGTNRFLVTPVSSGDATQFAIRFMGQFGDQDVAMMTGNGAGLTSTSTSPPFPITFAETIKGVYSATSFLSAFRFHPQYQSGRDANDGQLNPTVDPNRIDEVGAFFTSTTGTTGPAPKELFRVRMNTINDGTVAFTGSLAEIIDPGHDTLLFAGGNSSRDEVAASEIEIINSTPFTVTEAFSAIADTFTFPEFSASTVQSLTVKANDTPQPLTGITISAISTTNTSLGTLAIAPGGNSINFTPLANVSGTTTFTYTLRNATTGVTDTATVTINIGAVNDAPVNTVPGAQTTAEETAKVINGISISDSDASETVGATMQVDLTVQNGIINLASIPGGLVVNGNGTAAVNLQGSLADVNTAINGLLYTPALNFVGSDTFRIITNDRGNTGSGGAKTDNDTVAITVTGVNDAPTVVVPGDGSVPEGDPLVITGTSTGDVDVGSSPLKVTLSVTGIGTLTLDSTSGLTFINGTANGQGTLVFTGTLANVNTALSSYTYAPPIGDAGIQAISISVNDQGASGAGPAGGLTGSGSVTVDVIPLVKPFARRDSFTVVEESASNSLPVLDNDLVDDPVAPATVTDKLLLSVVTDTPHGTASISGDVVIYTPDADYSGTDTFTYVMNQDTNGDGTPDDLAKSSTGTVTVTITNVNDAPVAVDDGASTAEDTPLILTQADLKGNDTDIDNTNAQLSVTAVSGAVNGSVVLNANGTITFTPTANFTGSADFDYTVSDGGLTDTGHVAVTVTAFNDAPLAENGTLAATEDTAATGTLVATDIDSSTLTYSLVSTANAHGAVTITNASTGAYSYSPDAHYNGAASFTFKANDGVADSNVATVLITIAEVNDDPTANDDGTPVRITMIKNFDDQEIIVLANDSNAPDFNIVETLTIIRVAGSTTVGTTQLGNHVRISADGKRVLFDEDAGIEGNDQFTYTISDGRGGEATATVFVEVINFIPTDVTGTVYVDSNNNGTIDAGEKRLAGVKIVLEGHDDIFDIDFGADTDSDLTNDVAALVVYTDINGNYRFDAPGSLRPGMRPGSYTITEEQPRFMRDGSDQAGNNATLIANDRFAMTLPLLGIAGGINGNNFGERGLDPSVVSISEILASSTGNGLILAINGSSPLWQLRLTGWTNLKSASVVLSGDTSSATFTFTDMQNNVYTRTISQVGNPRFRIMGRSGSEELIRLEGTAADFGLNLLAAGGQGPQPEGEADVPRDAGYTRSVDAVMAEVGNA